MMVERCGEGMPAPRGAPVVEAKDDVSVLDQVLGTQVVRQVPRILDFLGGRATVDPHDGGIPAARGEPRRLEDGAVEYRAVRGLEGDELRGLQTERLRLWVLVRVEDADLLSRAV